MRIAGNKPDPTNLADIVSSMDGEANGFVDDVVVGIPPEPAPVPSEPVVTSPAVVKAERRGRKPKGIPPAVEPATAPPTPEMLEEGPDARETPVSDTSVKDEEQNAAAVDEVVEELKKKPVIEHGIPIPAHGNVGAVRYPFREMKKGDSFFVRQEPGESRKKLSARVRSASAQFRRRSTGEVVSFTTRMEKNGIRVWRLT